MLKMSNAACAELLRGPSNWYKPYWTLARLLQTQDKLTEALHEAELAADRNAGKDREVTQTLELIRRLNGNTKP